MNYGCFILAPVMKGQHRQYTECMESDIQIFVGKTELIDYIIG